MDTADLIPDACFTTDGKDIWRLKIYCLTPTCELHNPESGVIESFGMGGLTAGRFHRVKMPEVVQEKKGPHLREHSAV